jgi:hypothetical protein
MRMVDCPDAVRPPRHEPATCLDEALARQQRCRDGYRKVIGTSYEPGAYATLLEATRAVLDCGKAGGRAAA